MSTVVDNNKVDNRPNLESHLYRRCINVTKTCFHHPKQMAKCQRQPTL
ncbi:unnamed protein product [Paramecium octaurelia]|uniref:Uncharacterized protein n=1 Tax=Paramecium octaurelia TaxID=43137 RepID=A0A8S1WGB9_PAROT|nr:unnamed protein product [Paramecium octaurelia]